MDREVRHSAQKQKIIRAFSASLRLNLVKNFQNDFPIVARHSSQHNRSLLCAATYESLIW